MSVLSKILMMLLFLGVGAAAQNAPPSPQVLKRVAPIYPAIAKERKISGTLMVEADVDKNGSVTNMQLLSGPPVFRDAAFEAIKQGLFKPAMLNGQPISQKTQIRLQFTP